MARARAWDGGGMKINYRKEARGRDCQIRSRVCNHNPETSVLAHINGAGMGMKHNDLLAAISCSSCHAWVDYGFASDGATREERDLVHLRGMFRTLQVWISEGYL